MKSTRQVLVFALLSIILISCNRQTREVNIKISPEGGTYEAFEGATLDVPPGAVSTDVELSLRALSNSEQDELVDGTFPLVMAFEALPDGQSFTEPITITLENLDLEPGAIPLIRLIDEEERSRAIVDSNIEYDPDNNSLSFTVDHFTTYAVEAGKKVANLECQKTPCRCGSISIKQSDTDNSCSQDDCQVLESEVSVKFNDCDGKPVEESYLKEVSPGCTPRMELTAKRDTIPPEGSTSVIATTKLSCVPIPEQSTDFYIKSGPGSLDPTFQMTNSDGEAKSRFTAGEEEGPARIGVNATGHYYLYEVRVNGVTEYGPSKTYTLSDDTEVTIKEPEGIFEASFDGCNELICVQDYNIRAEFIVGEYQDGVEWFSTAEVTQSGNLTINGPYYVFDHQTIPSSTNLDIYGTFEKETDLYQLGLVSLNGELISFLMINPDMPDLIPIEGNIVGIFSGFNKSGQGLPFEFATTGSKSDQQGKAYLVLLGIGEGGGIEGNYTFKVE